MSATLCDYNKFRITHNHREVGVGKIVCENPELVKIGGLVTFDLTANVHLHDYVEISTGVQIFTHKHLWNHSKELRKDIQVVEPCKLSIGRDVFIGVNAIILGGVRVIGLGAVIGAGAVVTKKVPNFEIWAGNPARKIGVRGEQKQGYGTWKNSISQSLAPPATLLRDIWQRLKTWAGI